MRIVITGIGVQSPNGGSRSEYWDALSSGKSGLDTVTLFPIDGLACTVVGEVKQLSYECLPPKDRRRVPRIVPLAILASEEALKDADIGYETLTTAFGCGEWRWLFAQHQCDL